MKGTLRKDFTTKQGKNLKKGQEFEVIPPTKERPSVAWIAVDIDHLIIISINSLHKYFYQFHEVDLEDLYDAVNDSVTHTVTGSPVEPDGWDEHGFPSPLIAAGMI